jgi:hypothetical protein
MSARRIRVNPNGSLAALGAALLLSAACAAVDEHHGHGDSARDDARVEVTFPPELKEHTLANMRDHLLTLQRIQDALARGDFEDASRIAETRLGLSSLEAHGAHDVARYMPQGMQDIGTGMHKAASRFAIEASNAGATGDLKAVVGGLSAVTAQCVACHAGYRLK